MKRTLCALLAVLLLAGMLPAASPKAKAAVNPGFQALSQYLLENGEHDSIFGREWYAFSTEKSMWSSGSASCCTGLRLMYFPQDNFIEIWASLRFRDELCNVGPYDLDMILNGDGSYSNIYCSTSGGEARYTLNPAAITRTTIWNAYEYLDGNCPHSRLDDAASTLLKESLDALQLILNQKGKSIADLGFTAYQTGHVHQWDAGTLTYEPTCGGFGEREYRCSVCHSIALEYLLTVGDHVWDQGTVIQEPSCTEEGRFVQICTVCGYRNYTLLPALGHSWSFTRQVGYLADWEPLHYGRAVYTCTRCGETKDGRICAGEVFTDMPEDEHWAHDAIDWAYFGGITSGTTPSTFSPDMTITRSQAVTFLWAAAGKPEPETTENPFTDVTESDYFYKPVLWAREKGVTSGTGPNTFGPYEVCTRSQIVTFLWAAAGKPEPESTENPFQDVLETDYFYKAVLWARENGITSGTATDTFGSYDVCTRAQVVTFLYKASMVPAG